MNEQLNAAKDQAAREFNMDVSMFETPYPEYLNMKIFNQIINRAMEIYAEGVAVEFAERLRRNYTNHLTGGGGWRYYGDKNEKVITTQELFNQFKTTKP